MILRPIVLVILYALASTMPGLAGDESSEVRHDVVLDPDPRLAGLIEDPRLVRLKVLLSDVTTPLPVPLELLDAGRRRGETLGPRIVVSGAGANRLVVVEALVRALDPPNVAPDELLTAECAFVFNWRGQLVATLGGRSRKVRRTSVSQDHVDVLRLGPEEDWFARVMNSGEEPLIAHTEFYRLAETVVPSIGCRHHMNSSSWSLGPEERNSRFGYVGFDLPKVKDKLKSGEGGYTADGRVLDPNLIWDGDRNRFVGAPALFARDQPLYEVDVAWSREFEPLTPEVNHLVVTRGRDDWMEGTNMYHWAVAVPAESSASLVLSAPQPDGPAQIIRRELQPGLAYVSLTADAVDGQAATRFTLWISRKKEAFVVPFTLIGNELERQPLVRVLDPGEAAPLMSRPLEGAAMPVLFEIVSGELGEKRKSE